MSFTWFHRFRNPASDGASVGAPVSLCRVMSSLRTRTAQLRA